MNRLVIKYWELYPPPDAPVRDRRFESFELGEFCAIRQGMILPEVQILITHLADGARIDEIFGIWKGPELMGWAAFRYFENNLNVVALIGIKVYQEKLMDLLRSIAKYKRCDHITAKFIFQRQIPIVTRLGWREIRPGIYSLDMDDPIRDPEPDPVHGPGWEDVKSGSTLPASAGDLP